MKNTKWRKFFSLFLVFCLCLSLAPAATVSVLAAPGDIYVDEHYAGATPDGSEARPYKSLNDAQDALPSTGGTIVLKSSINLNATFVISKSITITTPNPASDNYTIMSTGPDWTNRPSEVGKDINLIHIAADNITVSITAGVTLKPGVESGHRIIKVSGSNNTLNLNGCTIVKQGDGSFATLG